MDQTRQRFSVVVRKQLCLLYFLRLPCVCVYWDFPACQHHLESVSVLLFTAQRGETSDVAAVLLNSVVFLTRLRNFFLCCDVSEDEVFCIFIYC